MADLVIQLQADAAPARVALEPLQVTLLGRAPDASQVPWDQLAVPADWPRERPWPPHRDVRCVRLGNAHTSANHLLAVSLPTVIALFDLTSRNGSWVALQQSQALLAPATADLHLSLGTHQPAKLRSLDPADAEWDQDQEFAQAVVQAIGRWISRLDLPVRVSHRRADGSSSLCHQPDGSSCAVLADESMVVLEPRLDRTIPSALAIIYEKIHTYIHAQNARYLQLRARHLGMVASSPDTRHLLLRVADAARREKRVVFLGPTGVGKELLARSYHGYSPWSSGPFVAVNCAQLDRELLHAQLFGAARGSFTGAARDVVGLLETADGGTLFLDELGEMSMDVQRSLLRFLDSRGEYYRLGDPKPRRVRVQIVCASNLPLSNAGFRERRFRDDLWYRLANVVVQVPPLRERRQDIVAFLSSRQPPSSDISAWEALCPGAQQWVLAYPWPGNFRELESFVESLPASPRRHALSPAQCEELLSAGASPGLSVVPRGPASLALAPVLASSDHGPTPPPPLTTLRRLRPEATPPANQDFDWNSILGRALQAFLEDHGAKPACWDQLYSLSEHYLKPLFIARAASLEDASCGRRVNYSAVARQLNIGDGSTVKSHLVRFERRFRSAESSSDRILGGQESA